MSCTQFLGSPVQGQDWSQLLITSEIVPMQGQSLGCGPEDGSSLGKW